MKPVYWEGFGQAKAASAYSIIFDVPQIFLCCLKLFLISDLKETPGKPTETWHEKMPRFWSKPPDEVIYVCIDFLWPFLVDEVSHSLHYNQLLQKWHFSLEATVVYVFLDTRGIIRSVEVSHNKLDWYFYWYSSPWCQSLPASATMRGKENHPPLYA